MKKIIFSILTLATILTIAAPISWAWHKDGNADCTEVFASIENDSHSRPWSGTITANGSTVVSTSGTASPNQTVIVQWPTTPGFIGTVNATISLSSVGQSAGDSNSFTEGVYCPQPSVSITPSVTPTPSQTPSTTPTITPTPTTNPCPNGCGGGPGDGLSDGRSDGRSDGKSGSTQPIQAVLGLSTTSSANTGLLILIQLVLAFTLSVFAYKLLNKNA